MYWCVVATILSFWHFVQKQSRTNHRISLRIRQHESLRSTNTGFRVPPACCSRQGVRVLAICRQCHIRHYFRRNKLSQDIHQQQTALEPTRSDIRTRSLWRSAVPPALTRQGVRAGASSRRQALCSGAFLRCFCASRRLLLALPLYRQTRGLNRPFGLRCTSPVSGTALHAVGCREPPALP